MWKKQDDTRQEIQSDRMIPGWKVWVLHGANPSRVEAGFSWNVLGMQYYGTG